MAWGPLALTQLMEWHDIQNPDDKLLDELAARYSLHPLHVEDCRQDAQCTKAETGNSYLFISLKQALGAPWPAVLEKIGEARSTLLELRRVLNSTRHVIVPLRHIPSPMINQELSPYLRDVHDDLTMILETIAADRDRLAGALNIFSCGTSDGKTTCPWAQPPDRRTTDYFDRPAVSADARKEICANLSSF
jgi:Mg2+ and Co2+ transporter CorA